jgi:hypothetical protein
MKVILSRKGFDSQYGGQPSPILPNGTLLSLPIPQIDDIVKFSELTHNGKSYVEIISELNFKNKKITSETKAHLDPDLRKDVYKQRKGNWKPIFGQSGAAQGHLRNQNVTINDIFLFFGWFKQTEIFKGKLRYKINSPDLHIIFGYLQIGEIYSFGDKFPEYAMGHPHCDKMHENLKSNCIYVAKDRLSFNETLLGAGTLNYNKNLVLTKDGMTKGKWELPHFFKDLEISYHTENSFENGYFKSADKGQEFVIKPNENLTLWAKELIEKN